MANNVKTFIKENLSMIILTILLFAAIFAVIFFRGASKRVKPVNYEDYLNKKESAIKEDVVYETKKFEENEYMIVSMNDYSLFNSYYRFYLIKMLNDPDASWDMLTEKCQSKFDNDFGKYKQHINEIRTVFTANNKVTQYKVTHEEDYDIVTVIDSENYKYDFYVYSVWNFKVDFVKQV